MLIDAEQKKNHPPKPELTNIRRPTSSWFLEFIARLDKQTEQKKLVATARRMPLEYVGKYKMRSKTQNKSARRESKHWTANEEGVGENDRVMRAVHCEVFVHMRRK